MTDGTPQSPRFIVVSGPSGVGKNTILNLVFEALPQVEFGRSATTRGPRHTDVPGKYEYVDMAQFHAMARSGRFLEHARFSGHRYGTLAPSAEQIARGAVILLEIEVQGASNIRFNYPDVPLVMLLPEGETEDERVDCLRARLEGRGGDSPAQIETRLARSRAEMDQGVAQADLVIVNEDPEKAARTIIDYICERFTVTVAS